MAKVMYKSGNYVVVTDANNLDRVFPIGKTVYDETNGNFLISEGQVEREQLIISVADTVNWVDDSAVNYTEATFREFLRANTGFRPASGGSGAAPIGAIPLKTGQITSYSSFDDGDIQAGRATDFFTLASNNPFGNTIRFTYIDGTQTYTNAIVIDWSTFDGTNVLGYGQNNNINVNWFDALTGSNTHSVGGYSSGWRLPNNYEVSNLFYLEQTWQLDYAPLSTSLGIGYSHRDLWLSTTRANSSISAYKIDQIYGIQTKGKTSVGCKYFPVRTFTVNGTTLT